MRNILLIQIAIVGLLVLSVCSCQKKDYYPRNVSIKYVVTSENIEAASIYYTDTYGNRSEDVALPFWKRIDKEVESGEELRLSVFYIPSGSVKLEIFIDNTNVAIKTYESSFGGYVGYKFE